MTEKAQTPSRWQKMAGERNARVILCNTPDTYSLTDLARYADRSVRALRNRLLISMQPEEVLPLLEDYQSVIIKLNNIVKKMCEAVKLDFDTPRSVKRMIGDDGNGNGDKSAGE